MQRVERTVLLCLAAVMVFGIGFVAGMAYPGWDGKDCHVMGGSLHVVPGPGKPTACVIPWDEY